MGEKKRRCRGIPEALGGHTAPELRDAFVGAVGGGGHHLTGEPPGAGVGKAREVQARPIYRFTFLPLIVGFLLFIRFTVLAPTGLIRFTTSPPPPSFKKNRSGNRASDYPTNRLNTSPG